MLLAVPPAAGGARTAGDFSVETLARFLAAVRTKVAWLEVERARLRATAGGGAGAGAGEEGGDVAWTATDVACCLWSDLAAQALAAGIAPRPAPVPVAAPPDPLAISSPFTGRLPRRLRAPGDSRPPPPPFQSPLRPARRAQPSLRDAPPSSSPPSPISLPSSSPFSPPPRASRPGRTPARPRGAPPSAGRSPFRASRGSAASPAASLATSPATDPADVGEALVPPSARRGRAPVDDGRAPAATPAWSRARALWAALDRSPPPPPATTPPHTPALSAGSAGGGGAAEARGALRDARRRAEAGGTPGTTAVGGGPPTWAASVADTRREVGANAGRDGRQAETRREEAVARGALLARTGAGRDGLGAIGRQEPGRSGDVAAIEAGEATAVAEQLEKLCRPGPWSLFGLGAFLRERACTARAARAGDPDVVRRGARAGCGRSGGRCRCCGRRGCRKLHSKTPMRASSPLRGACDHPPAPAPPGASRARAAASAGWGGRGVSAGAARSRLMMLLKRARTVWSVDLSGVRLARAQQEGLLRVLPRTLLSHLAVELDPDLHAALAAAAAANARKHSLWRLGADSAQNALVLSVRGCAGPDPAEHPENRAYLREHARSPRTR